ncbi:MAG: helix-turn-helix domain-containing protein [Nocardioides sp.]|jgi:AcrR family transcriptional regulator
MSEEGRFAGVRRRPSTGRPRDRRIDEAILVATRELLAEVGYTRLSIPMVAARAGATPPAVHRRFASKLELVFEAAFPSAEDFPITWVGDDIESDVDSLIRGALKMFTQPVMLPAVSGILAELAANPGEPMRLLGRLHGPNYAVLQERLDAVARERGAFSGLRAETVMDMVGGTIFMSLMAARKLDEQWIGEVRSVILRGILTEL